MSKCNLIISKYALLLYYVFTIPTLCNAANADGSVQDRITPLEQRVTKLEQDVSKLTNAQQDTNQRIQVIQTEQENEKKIIQNIQTINQDIQNKNQNITQDIQNIHKSIAELSDKINSLDNNHKENIKEITEKLKKLNEMIEQIDIKKYNENIEKLNNKNSEIDKYINDHSEALKQLLKEITEMKELFCNNVLDGKCSLDDFSKLVKNANKNWKKGNINDLINSLPKKDETTTIDSNDEQTDKTTIVSQSNMNNELIKLMQQIQSSNQSNSSLDDLMKTIQQHISNPNTKQMDLYNQVFQYMNQINQPGNIGTPGANYIDENLIRKYLKQKNRLNPQQFQKWLSQQQLDDPKNYPKLLALYNKFNTPQLLINDPTYQNWWQQRNFGTSGNFIQPNVPRVRQLNPSQNNVKQNTRNNMDGSYGSIGQQYGNFQQQDGDYDSGEQQYEPSDDINNVPLVNTINEDSDLDPHSNSSQDASYGSGGQQHNPAYQYYYRNYNDWPYNKNDPNRYPRGYAYHYGNNTNSNNNVNDIDPGSVDPNNPNSNNVNIGNQNFDGVNPNNPGNIRPGNVYPGGKQIKRVNNNINHVVLTDCNGQKRKLSQNDVMNLIRQGAIQYKCN